MSDLMTVKNLSKSFPHGHETLHVLRELDFKLGKGEFVSVVGASGAGKSTLLHLLGSLDHPTGGELCLDGCEYSKMENRELAEMRNEKIGFVFQFHHLLPEFTAIENVMMPELIRGRSRKETEPNARELLNQLGLRERLSHRPPELSGGEQQRVAISRSMINGPSILFCDEPTGNLDSESGKEIIDLLVKLNKENEQSLVIVTHDAKLAEIATSTIFMKDGLLLDKKTINHRQ